MIAIRNRQVVTILKNTTKLVTDVPFPALTICGSGVHMNNVEKKLIRDFDNWREKNNRNETSKEAVYKDTEEFMETRFQIRPNMGKENQSTRDHPISILDILDTMIAPDVDASVAANSVRENVEACKESSESRKDTCVYQCPTGFSLSGTKCFHVSSDSERAVYAKAQDNCVLMGAQLATISNQEENQMVKSLMTGGSNAYIGLNDRDTEGTFLWQDGTFGWKDGFEDNPFNNWGGNGVEPNDDATLGAEDCVMMIQSGCWADLQCQLERRYACSMAAEESCDTGAALAGVLHQRSCIQTNIESNETNIMSAPQLPGVDIFLNPAKEQERERIVKKKKDTAKNFFAKARMAFLYPELFRILWESTLPCVEEEKDPMIVSCELARAKINCSKLFTRVPTDIGMCCAINVADSLRASDYQQLVKEMQGDKKAKHVESEEGSRN